MLTEEQLRREMMAVRFVKNQGEKTEWWEWRVGCLVGEASAQQIIGLFYFAGEASRGWFGKNFPSRRSPLMTLEEWAEGCREYAQELRTEVGGC